MEPAENDDVMYEEPPIQKQMFLFDIHLLRSSLCFARVAAFPAFVIPRRIVFPLQASEGPCSDIFRQKFSILLCELFRLKKNLFYLVDTHGVPGIDSAVVCVADRSRALW